MSYQIVNNIITFNFEFNKILDDKIIQIIKLYNTIYFICKFNKPINYLPNLIIHLILYTYFK